MSELKQAVEDVNSKVEWEGGLMGALEHSGPNLFNLGDKALLEAANAAFLAYNKFLREWVRICLENDVEPE